MGGALDGLTVDDPRARCGVAGARGLNLNGCHLGYLVTRVCMRASGPPGPG